MPSNRFRCKGIFLIRGVPNVAVGMLSALPRFTHFLADRAVSAVPGSGITSNPLSFLKRRGILRRTRGSP